jgi:hypothetical protein
MKPTEEMIEIAGKAYQHAKCVLRPTIEEKWPFMRYALTAALADVPEPASFICKYRNSGVGGNDPQECAWPECGCDPAANRVIEHYLECGLTLVKEGEVEALRQRVQEMENNAKSLRADKETLKHGLAQAHEELTIALKRVRELENDLKINKAV